jgi:hypothetical protein
MLKTFQISIWFGLTAPPYIHIGQFDENRNGTNSTNLELQQENATNVTEGEYFDKI